MSESPKPQRPPKDVLADIKARSVQMEKGGEPALSRDFESKDMNRKPTEKEIYEITKQHCLDEIELELNEWYWRTGETDAKPMLMEWVRRTDGEGVTIKIVKKDAPDD
jgi:hypothetical protein